MEKSAFYIDIQNKDHRSKRIGELYSAISHGIGALLGIAGLVLMLVKIKVVAEQHVSYLTAMTDTEVNSRELEKEIEKLILESVQSNIVYKKGEADGSVYFVISSIKDSKEFLTELVEQSSKLIKNYES